MKRTKKNTHIWQLLATLLLLVTAFVLSACSSDDTNATPNDVNESEIRFNPSVWQVLEGTRATFYDTGASLASGSFICYAFNANSTTPYINQTTVNYTAGQWTFEDGKHYWPADGSLDFFAYMPVGGGGYVNSIAYTTARNPQFNCVSLPMTYNSASSNEGQGSDLQEFVFALVTDRTKALDGANGVTLNFQHPFACIKFLLSASHPNIIINSITFKGIKNNGSYSHNSSPKWTTTGDATNFVMTLTEEAATFNNNTTTKQIGTDYLMIPQEWTGEIEVNASWNDWGDTPVAHTVTTTIQTITWQPGYSYTYTFTISPDDLIVDTTNFTEQW